MQLYLYLGVTRLHLTPFFNRPGVAGDVLQSPPLLIDSIFHPLVQISSKHCQSQTGRARELKFLENGHPTLCVTCHMSHVKKITFNFFLLKKMDKVVEGLLSTGPTPSSL